MSRDATVRDFMSKKLVVLDPETDVLRAMQTLLDNEISGAPVVDAHGSVVGLLTERDCLTVAYGASYHQDPAGKVADYMSREVETIPAGMAIVEVLGVFLRSPYRRFPVMDGSQLVGQLSRRDVLKAIVEQW